MQWEKLILFLRSIPLKLARQIRVLIAQATSDGEIVHTYKLIQAFIFNWDKACLTVSNFMLMKAYTVANFLGRQDVETYFWQWIMYIFAWNTNCILLCAIRPMCVVSVFCDTLSDRFGLFQQLVDTL